MQLTLIEMSANAFGEKYTECKSDYRHKIHQSPRPFTVSGTQSEQNDITCLGICKNLTPGDICIGIGAINPDGEEVKIDEQDVEDAVDSDADEYEAMSPAKRTTVKIISAILLIIFACLLIWGTDAVTGWIKGLF